MAIIRVEVNPGDKLSPEDVAMLENLKKHPKPPTDDFPELTEEQIKNLRRVNPGMRHA